MTRTNLSTEIEAEVHEKLSRAADMMEAGSAESARAELLETFGLLPEPREEWDIAFLIQMAAAQCELDLGDYRAALKRAEFAVECATADDVAIQLMRGKAYYELGEEELACEAFLLVLLEDGSAAFAEEEPKYLAFAKQRIRPPAGFESWDDCVPN